MCRGHSGSRFDWKTPFPNMIFSVCRYLIDDKLLRQKLAVAGRSKGPWRGPYAILIATFRRYTLLALLI